MSASSGVPLGSWLPPMLTSRPSAPICASIVCAGRPVVVLVVPPIVDLKARSLSVMARSAVPEASTDLTWMDSFALISKLSGIDMPFVVTVCFEVECSLYLNVSPAL